MLARLRKAQEEREGGFTLIALLVVVIIIGILAAIAIPVFLNQRKKAYDTAIKNDLHSAALAQEAYMTDNNNYDAVSPIVPGTTALVSQGLKFSPTSNYQGGAQTMTAVYWDSTGAATTTSTAATGGFCLVAQASSGNYFMYNNTNGGLSGPTTSAPTCTFNGVAP